MITAWRIVQTRWAGRAFDGEGARLYGGRWNPPGLSVVYLADTRALAALETLVHAEGSLRQVQYVRYPVSFSKQLIETAALSELTDALSSLTVSPRTQTVGRDWLRRAQQPILEVRSAIIPEEPNYLLNPRHAKFDRIKIGKAEPCAFDPRLI
ncbi:RES family NAD+ phosphorylase [Coraliomargarita sp. SDUM461004]|uniref:RES family NAD+ phosphorylase n=1 Tax=Thalassobacterium sedimentorum TaxID=3041258 RepID=A0ABU1AMQ2_9BACT|nr:RES family NAD+ phosphorylase [Coraliomargarita sp. SDUM461004]MDQ8195130.1 RES family NAD+ phosphorylase [Coraliomargarita sp. SDUM461004]